MQLKRKLNKKSVWLVVLIMVFIILLFCKKELHNNQQASVFLAGIEDTQKSDVKEAVGKNKYFSSFFDFEIDGKYILKEPDGDTSQDGEIFLFKSLKGIRAAVSRKPLQGDLIDEPAVKMRRLDVKKYKESKIIIAGTEGLEFDEGNPVISKVAFVVNGKQLITIAVSLVSSNDTAALEKDFQEIVDSVKWKQL